MLFMSVPAPAERSGPDNQTLDECIRRMARGDQEGLATLYEMNHAAVYGFTLSILKNVDDAQDITQDTFVQLFRVAGQYRSQQKPMAWILTIARNLALNHYKERQRTTPVAELDLSPLDHQSQVTSEDRMVLHSLLSQLGEEERQIVTLHALTGLKHREIAGLLHCSEANVKVRIHRARALLLKTFAE